MAFYISRHLSGPILNQTTVLAWTLIKIQQGVLGVLLLLLSYVSNGVHLLYQPQLRSPLLFKNHSPERVHWKHSLERSLRCLKQILSSPGTPP
jgi:hypothetical protein